MQEKLEKLLFKTKTFSHSSRSIQFVIFKLGELYFLVNILKNIFFLQYAEKYGGDTLNRASFDEELNQLDSWLVRANTSIQETRKLTSEEINAAFNEITQITSEVAEMETLFKSLSRRFQVIKQKT